MEVRKVTAENKQSYFRTCYAHNCKWQRRTHWLGVQVGKGNSPPPGCSAVRQRYLSVWAHSNTVTGKPLRKGHALHLKEQNHSMISHFQSVKVSLSMAWRPCMTWPFTSLTSFPTSAALADSLSALFDTPLMRTTLALPELLCSQAPRTETLFPTYLCALKLSLNGISSEVFPVHS